MDDKAGLTITMPTALFERLLKEAMARGVALSAHALLSDPARVRSIKTSFQKLKAGETP